MTQLEKVLEKVAEATETNSKLIAAMAQNNNNNFKAAANVQTANQLHGFDGLWATTTERDVITAHIRAKGVSSILPKFASNDENPRYGILTGYTDSEGAEPENACDDAPAGFVKGCTLTARFGMTRRDTQTVEFDKVMRRLHRGDFMDLNLRGRVLGLTDLVPSGLNESEILNIILMSEMVTAGVGAERKLVKEIWQGSWGVSTEFPGLDSQIATGHVDADENVACPAVDSDVKDFAYDDIEGSGRSIVDYMSMMEWYLFFNANRMGLDPVTWVIVLRPELWQVLTEVWPCQYNTNRCSSAMIGANSRTVIDGRENIADRDSMRSGMNIEINGRVYPVVVDDGIYEANNINDGNLNPAEYASSIYFLPLSITGNFPVTYIEHIDYRDPIANRNVALLRGTNDFWTDGGVWSWAAEYQKWCFKLALKTEQRIILRTPQLAGKIQNVKYAPLQHLRSSDPTSPYWADGGLSLRNTDDSFSAVWA